MLLPWRKYAKLPSYRRSRLQLEYLEDRFLLANNVFTVTALTDNGTGQNGTLSAAINGANASAVGDTNTINFNLGNAPNIVINGELPAITKPVTIDGWSQTRNTVAVVLNGVAAPLATDGLTLNTGGCIIRGLAIEQFNGNGIVINNASGSNAIYDCNIGTDLAGTGQNLGNGKDGILIQGPSNVIGSVFWNVISGNGGSGIDIKGAAATSNVLVGNRVGVDKTGTAALENGQTGIFVQGGANGNEIGDLAPQFTPSNVISGNSRAGVFIQDSNNNEVVNNFIGLGSDGTTIVGNGSSGVALRGTSSGNEIGIALDGNVISGNTSSGVGLSGPGLGANYIRGNFIGTDDTGTVAKPNQVDGVYTEGPSVTIGGVNPGERNVISGNIRNGVTMKGAAATGNLVSINLIGTDLNGTAANLGNGDDGVYIDSGASNDTVGSAGATDANGKRLPTVISSNGNAGVEIGGNYNYVVNCNIGTDLTGKKKQDANQNNFGNARYGVEINGGSYDTIGGLGGLGVNGFMAGLGNLISGNTGYGVAIVGTGQLANNIFGNYIGTDVNGTNPLGNDSDGVYNAVNSNNTAIEGNLISANGSATNGVGVWLDGSNNVVQNNIIGLDVNGNVVMALANAGGWRGSTDPDPNANGNTWQNNQHN
jgi:titin